MLAMLLPFCVFTNLWNSNLPVKVLVEELEPQGLRFSIPDVPGITFFGVKANINRGVVHRFDATHDVTGRLAGLFPVNGRWSYEDRNVKVEPGDVIHYCVSMKLLLRKYQRDFRYVVPDHADYTAATTAKTVQKPQRQRDQCHNGVTTVHGEPVCVGKTIFFDNFDTPSTDKWRIEHKIAFDHPEYPFISYQRSAVSVRDGHLYIEPSLQEDKPSFNEDSIYTGKLDLTSGCTGHSTSCQMTASGINILPPVVSGRITSKNFSFRYGVVEIRAKLPQGDWLYPEILLEPFSYEYGTSEYASGLLKTVTARGNLELLDGDVDIGNQVLYGGPVVNKQCRDALLFKKIKSDNGWGDEFHTYTMRWTPDEIILSVDNEEWARIEPRTTLLRELPSSCQSLATRANSEKFKSVRRLKMAPFDREFVLSLGVAAGGVTEFPDAVGSKPWNNTSCKAKLHFWEQLNSWYPTWGDQRFLVVDYINVTAV